MTHPLALARQYAEQEADTSTCRQLLRAALDEVDRLRRLPVLASCGDCAHACVEEGGWACGKTADPSIRNDVGAFLGDDLSAEPPTWCPLRGKL